MVPIAIAIQIRQVWHSRLWSKSIYQTLPTSRIQHKVNFKWSLTVLHSDFSFSYNGCHTMFKEPKIFYHASIAKRGIIRSLYFPTVLALWEMQIVLARIWTRFSVFTFDDNKCYTTSTRCMRSVGNDRLRSPTLGLISTVRSAKTYIHQFFTNMSECRIDSYTFLDNHQIRTREKSADQRCSK